MPLLVNILPRRLWDALAARYAYQLPVQPVTHVFIHNGATFAPLNLRDEDGDGVPDNEESIWGGYQRYHMTTRGWSDIAYNFGVGKSGSILEGRGWTRQGGATGSPQDRYSLSICAIGNFDANPTTPEMVTAISNWIITGIELGHIAPDATILGHRDKPYETACPGRHLYEQLPLIRSLVADGRVEETMDTPISEWYLELRNAPDGTKNEAVRLWQWKLYEWDHLAIAQVDGVCGPITRAAQLDFEEARNYEQANGKPGKYSWEVLLAGPYPAAPAPDTSSLELAVSLIEGLIEELSA